MWMNTWDIDEMVYIAETEMTEVVPFARYLADWRDVVNQNSDGWSSWKAGSKCAEKLMNLLNEAKQTRFGGGDLPPRELFMKSLSPIKRLATTKGLTAPELVEPGMAPAAPAPGMR